MDGTREVIRSLTPASPADRAGLKTGDIILALDGQPVQPGFPWLLMRNNLRIGGSFRIEVERNRERLEIPVSIGRVEFGYRMVHTLWQFDEILLLATALFIAFARPYDRLARMGGLALATLSVGLYFTNLPPGYAAMWRNLPWVPGILLWIPFSCICLIGPIVLTFFANFPRPLFLARWIWVVIWLPALLLLPPHLYFTSLVVYFPPRAYQGFPPIWQTPIHDFLYATYGLAAVAALAANYVRLTDASDRRRIRMLFLGGVAGVFPGLLRWAMAVVAPKSPIFRFLNSTVPDVFIAVVFALFPVCFAYSILRHRLFDIRVIIRLGIQYALARGGMIAIVPVLGGILFLDMLAHGNQTLIEILGARGWVYAALSGVAIVAYLQRRRWGEAIDRRFFREHYDARRLLRGIAEEARQAGSFSRAAQGIVTRIERALHPQFAALMQRLPDETAFRTLASAPAGQAPPVLPSESRWIESLRALGKPMGVMPGDTNRLRQQLPDQEIEFVHRSRIELFVPIAMSPGHDEALLALGPKRSEEPYTSEDKELLDTIAASLALLFEQETIAALRTTGSFGECPRCGTCSDAGSSSCAQDGAALTPVPLPRMLAGRYRLERRRGRGGMGIIYEAMDKALGRRVAVKVIREELVNSSAAARRFALEARAAGAFVHPNVVTVHDYGVEGDRRAFLVMELLEGVTLRDELKLHKRLDAAHTLRIFRQVCSAVDAAHRHQLIHRDIKPENIFLAQSTTVGDGLVKILDFGIAKFLCAAENIAELQGVTETGTGILVGTAGYMSPEQLLGERPDIGWDLWALAVAAYETLTGALPFPVTNRYEWRQSVLAGAYTPLSEHLHNPPAAWEQCFAGLLATDRARRPPSAMAFYRDLENALA